MIDVYVHGYCWHGDHAAKYLKYHRLPLELVGFDMSCNHLAIQFNDWIVHPFNNKLFESSIRWIKQKVSDRCFGKTCKSLYIGATDKTLGDLVNYSNTRETRLWSCYAWFYTLGLYRNKKDCVSFTKEMLEYSMEITGLHGVTPNTLLQELHNRGY